jgi:putative intracellular protease/amidase
VDVAILVFDGMTVLDAVGPYEVLSRLPAVDVTMVGTERAPESVRRTAAEQLKRPRSHGRV